MTTLVTFPNIAETHVRATWEILHSYFDGAAHILGQRSITFPLLGPDQILQDIRDLKKDNKIFLVLAEGTVLNDHELKVNDPDGVLVDGSVGHAYEKRCLIRRNVMGVSVRDAADSAANYREAVRLYDMAFAIFSTQPTLFAHRGIFRIEMESIPYQVPHPDYALAMGRVLYEVRASYTKS